MTPTDMLNIAQLGITSGNAWGAKYGALTSATISQADYLQFHIDMRDTLIAQTTNNDARNQAIAALKQINKDIASHTKFLKSYLEEEYGQNFKTYFTGYGLEFENQKFKIPLDNDRRMNALNILVIELSKLNNPIASRKYGLIFWQNLRDSHRDNWTLLKTLDGSRSLNSSSLAAMRKQALAYQSNLRLLVKVNYPANYKSVWRDLGFQVEKY